MSQYVWLDKKLTLLKEGNFPLLDEGFLYGQGLFETMRAYNGKVFLLERHLKRLINSCRQLNMPPPKQELLKKAINNTIRRNKLCSGYVRLNVWQAKRKLRNFVFIKKIRFCSNKDYLKGFSGMIIKNERINDTSFLSHNKTLNYLFYSCCRSKAAKHGADEAILLNTKGFICEGSRSNIFVVRKNKVITPHLNCGCLPGITRGVVFELCRKLKISIKQQNLKSDDLFKSQEIFLTNSLIEIMPLVRIDKRLIGDGKPGELSLLLLSKYREYIQKQINKN